jgi:hypothetical protein
VEISETRYAQSGDVNIAYRIAGDGPFDVVWIPPGISNVERAFDAVECSASSSSGLPPSAA